MCFITICRRVWNIIIRKLAVPGATGKKRSVCYFLETGYHDKQTPVAVQIHIRADIR